MPRVKHDEGKKDSALVKLVRYKLDHSLVDARIAQLESKIALLDQAVTVLKSEVKFIADMLRKEQPKK
ncbi:hypothetical protein ES705_29616 [subsurface metagenome]